MLDVACFHFRLTMQDHRLQSQRFELKYLVPGEFTQPMRDFVGSYLELDDYSVGKPNNSYEVHSVYLDSDRLDIHHATFNGDKNRFKLRLRYYDADPASPVFCEIKQRVDNCILKRRCAVARADVPQLLAGQLPEPDELLSPELRHLVSLQRFLELMLQLDARPRLHNYYRREAWVSPHDNSIRITFDRHISVEPYFRPDAPPTMTRPTRIYTEFIVLELKFTGRFPNWFHAFVERFNLMRTASMKYSGGVEMLGEHRFLKPDSQPEVSLAEVSLEPLNLHEQLVS
ncbi:MAG: polyphosphate polymerase domain-containing protein [Verrucomicrobia bacterium]|nr:MAG: polyphosphate polymerase domain-containing protein [Verrucomicrobiota bacterium]